MTLWPTFAHPLVLLLVPLVPLLLLAWSGRSRPALRYAQIALLQDLPRGRARWARHGGWLLRGLGLIALIVALAGPRWPDPGSRIPAEGIAITLVFDVSASMARPDFLWDDQLLTRLEGVRKIFHQFVERRPQDLIGLVTFATRPDTACPLTLDHAALARILDDVQPRTDITEATTNPGDALAWALVGLHKAPTRRKVIVFLTDGEANVPPPALQPRQAAQLAGNLDIPIYVIDANPDSPEAENTTSPADNIQAKRILEEVARISAGRYFQATNARSLGDVSAQIDALERSSIVSFEYRRYHEGFTWFAAAALGLWLLLVLLESTLWRKVP